MTNRLKEVRENLLLSRAELARKAGVCFLTITRVEKGLPCRGETKRKILAGLGLKSSQRDMVFSSTHPQKKSWISPLSHIRRSRIKMWFGRHFENRHTHCTGEIAHVLCRRSSSRDWLLARVFWVNKEIGWLWNASWTEKEPFRAKEQSLRFLCMVLYRRKPPGRNRWPAPGFCTSF